MDVHPSRRYEPDEIVVCPYDAVHRVKINRLPYHLLKCAKQHPDAEVFGLCPYNARHVIKTKDAASHFVTCPDKPPVQDHRKIHRGKTDLPDNSSWSAPCPDEAWDAEFRASDDEEFVNDDGDDDDDDDEAGHGDVDSVSVSERSTRRGNCPVSFTRRAAEPSSNPVRRPVALASTRPPLSSPRFPSNPDLDSSHASSSTPQPVSLSMLNPSKLQSLSKKEHSSDVAAWCNQQAQRSQPMGTGRGVAIAQDTSTPQAGVASATESLSGYLPLHRGRGMLLSQVVPMRRPGMGLKNSSNTSQSAASTARECADHNPAVARKDFHSDNRSDCSLLSDCTSESHLATGRGPRSGLDSDAAGDSGRLAAGMQTLGHSALHSSKPSLSNGGGYDKSNPQRQPETADVRDLPHNTDTQTRRPNGLSACSTQCASSPVLASSSHAFSQPPSRSSHRHELDGQPRSRSPCSVASSSPGSLRRPASNSSCRIESRVANISKLLALIEDLVKQQSRGESLHSTEVALIARRSELLDEKHSLLC